MDQLHEEDAAGNLDKKQDLFQGRYDVNCYVFKRKKTLKLSVQIRFPIKS